MYLINLFSSPSFLLKVNTHAAPTVNKFDCMTGMVSKFANNNSLVEGVGGGVEPPNLRNSVSQS